MLHLNLVDISAFIFFVISWNLYATYARKKSDKNTSLNQEMRQIRRNWVKTSLATERQFRIPDIQLINVLHRGISFFVSTTILIIAGLLTFIASGETLVIVLKDTLFFEPNIEQTWRIKVFLTVVLFVICFFRLTWAIRQNQYAAITLMSVKNISELSNKQINDIVDRITWIFTDSGNNFNHGLRSYYFGLAILSWVVSPYFLIVMTLIVLAVLYRREFASNTFNLLQDLNGLINKIADLEQTKKDI